MKSSKEIDTTTEDAKKNAEAWRQYYCSRFSVKAANPFLFRDKEINERQMSEALHREWAAVCWMKLQ